MNKTEKKHLIELQEVCEMAETHVSSANYNSRSRLARANIRKAFDDFSNGVKPEWDESLYVED